MLAATFTSNKNENTFLAALTTYDMEKEDLEIIYWWSHFQCSGSKQLMRHIIIKKRKL